MSHWASTLFGVSTGDRHKPKKTRIVLKNPSEKKKKLQGYSYIYRNKEGDYIIRKNKTIYYKGKDLEEAIKIDYNLVQINTEGWDKIQTRIYEKNGMYKVFTIDKFNKSICYMGYSLEEAKKNSLFQESKEYEYIEEHIYRKHKKFILNFMHRGKNKIFYFDTYEEAKNKRTKYFATKDVIKKEKQDLKKEKFLKNIGKNYGRMAWTKISDYIFTDGTLYETSSIKNCNHKGIKFIEYKGNSIELAKVEEEKLLKSDKKVEDFCTLEEINKCLFLRSDGRYIVKFRNEHKYVGYDFSEALKISEIYLTQCVKIWETVKGFVKQYKDYFLVETKEKLNKRKIAYFGKDYEKAESVAVGIQKAKHTHVERMIYKNSKSFILRIWTKNGLITHTCSTLEEAQKIKREALKQKKKNKEDRKRNIFLTNQKIKNDKLLQHE